MARDWGSVEGDEHARVIMSDAKRGKTADNWSMGLALLGTIALGVLYANSGERGLLVGFIFACMFYVVSVIHSVVGELKTWMLVTEQRARLIESAVDDLRRPPY